MYKINSKNIQKGDVYIVLPNGEKYISEAINNKAAGYLTMNRDQLGHFANDIFDNPSKLLTVIGVTGTNGKTTVVNVVNELLNKKGFKSICIGTLNARLTTPESIEVIKMMKNHLDQGGTHFVMEVSSHAIAQNRVAGINFDVKALTNITQYHLGVLLQLLF